MQSVLARAMYSLLGKKKYYITNRQDQFLLYSI